LIPPFLYSGPDSSQAIPDGVKDRIKGTGSQTGLGEGNLGESERAPEKDTTDAPSWTVPSFPFRDHIVRQPGLFPETATEADKHMFGIEGERQVSWEQFKDLIADKDAPEEWCRVSGVRVGESRRECSND
jgi:hypothetical protein